VEAVIRVMAKRVKIFLTKVEFDTKLVPFGKGWGRLLQKGENMRQTVAGVGTFSYI
jgi:hypothetical protein